MAGHSKWANIQHRKGRQDAARSKLFSKLAKEITVAAKMGDPDPDKNPRLRLAVKEAKASSCPKDVIERAIKKSLGGDAENYEEIRYEGYGPGGVAVIVEAMTDNRNRTASTVRSTFGKHGGNLGETGSVSFMFERKGEIVYPLEAGDEARARHIYTELAPLFFFETQLSGCYKEVPYRRGVIDCPLKRNGAMPLDEISSAYLDEILAALAPLTGCEAEAQVQVNEPVPPPPSAPPPSPKSTSAS